MPFANTYAFITAAALALLSVSGKDKQISSYAMEHTPIFHSRERAQKASDALSYVSFGITAAVYAIKHLPAMDDIPFDYQHRPAYKTVGGKEAAIDDFMGIALSGALTSITTEMLKDYTGRVRPNGMDSLSYPSGHTTAAAWLNHSTIRMISDFDIPPQYALPAHGVLSLLTLGMAWSRVEAGKHYPSDVLAGILVGVALTNASFAFFQNGGQTHNVKFNLQFTTDKAAAITGMSVTIDF